MAAVAEGPAVMETKAAKVVAVAAAAVAAAALLLTDNKGQSNKSDKSQISSVTNIQRQ